MLYVDEAVASSDENMEDEEQVTIPENRTTEPPQQLQPPVKVSLL